MPDLSQPTISREKTEVDLLPWDTAIDQYDTAWSRIVSSERMNPTLMPGWLDIVIRSHQPPDPVRVMVLNQNRELQAAVPFFSTQKRQLGVAFKTTELLANCAAYHVRPTATIACFDFWNILIDNLPDWDIFRASNLVENDAAAESIQSFAQEKGLGLQIVPVERSPYLPINSDWDTYLSGKKKKFRYKVRQREESLRGESRLTHISFQSPTDSQNIVDDLLRIEKQSWKAKYGLDIGSREKECAYYRLLMPFLSDHGALHADFLYYDKTPIAYSLCVNWQGWFGQLKTSFNESYSNLSPGAIVVDESIKAAFNADATEFDFLGDMDRHKLAWTKEVRRHNDYFLFNRNAKSRLLFIAKSLKNRIVNQQRIASVKPNNSNK